MIMLWTSDGRLSLKISHVVNSLKQSSALDGLSAHAVHRVVIKMKRLQSYEKDNNVAMFLCKNTTNKWM